MSTASVARAPAKPSKEAGTGLYKKLVACVALAVWVVALTVVTNVSMDAYSAIQGEREAKRIGERQAKALQAQIARDKAERAELEREELERKKILRIILRKKQRA